MSGSKKRHGKNLFRLGPPGPLPPGQRRRTARRAGLGRAARPGMRPHHLPPSEAAANGWKINWPGWCGDQPKEMTGPADDAELVVKMLNSGAPGVMLDVEDSM